jgi:hypothetical protein
MGADICRDCNTLLAKDIEMIYNISFLAILSLLIVTPHAFGYKTGEQQYQSGYQHGVSDAHTIATDGEDDSCNSFHQSMHG